MLQYVLICQLSPARRSVDVTLLVTAAMAPGSVVLVWYPRLDPLLNTVLASAIFVPQQNLLQYQVRLVFDIAVHLYGVAVELKKM